MAVDPMVPRASAMEASGSKRKPFVRALDPCAEEIIGRIGCTAEPVANPEERQIGDGVPLVPGLAVARPGTSGGGSLHTWEKITSGSVSSWPGQRPAALFSAF